MQPLHLIDQRRGLLWVPALAVTQSVTADHDQPLHMLRLPVAARCWVAAAAAAAAGCWRGDLRWPPRWLQLRPLQGALRYPRCWCRRPDSPRSRRRRRLPPCRCMPRRRRAPPPRRLLPPPGRRCCRPPLPTGTRVRPSPTLRRRARPAGPCCWGAHPLASAGSLPAHQWRGKGGATKVGWQHRVGHLAPEARGAPQCMRCCAGPSSSRGGAAS